ncbi:hypothetical protein JOB18_010034 [Solea senegalensis]|nr:hypothetical protein JOB18_010034 [Solea senegalensis]
MVEANPVKPAYLLRFIHDEAMALKNKTLPDVYVTYKRHSGICWTKFFCLAWETLDTANLNEMEKLKRLIHRYNNAYGFVNCALEKHQSQLMRFLEDIISCSFHGPIPHPPKDHTSGSH